MTEPTREEMIVFLEGRAAREEHGWVSGQVSPLRLIGARLKADGEEIADLRDALTQAEACMSIVAPRSDKAEYLRILGVVRAALKE